MSAERSISRNRQIEGILRTLTRNLVLGGKGGPSGWETAPGESRREILIDHVAERIVAGIRAFRPAPCNRPHRRTEAEPSRRFVEDDSRFTYFRIDENGVKTLQTWDHGEERAPENSR